MQVEIIEIPTEITEASIKAYIAKCSSVVRNKDPKDNDRLFDRLLKESFGDTASRVLQYIPCKIEYSRTQYSSGATKFYGFITDNIKSETEVTWYYTTARELFNWGWTMEEILPTIDFTHYKAVRVTAPRFIYNQLQTHDNVTSVSFSARYSDNPLGYWMPEEYFGWMNSRILRAGDREYIQSLWNSKVENYSPHDLKQYMNKSLGIARKEIYNRGADGLEYVVFTLGSFTNHPHYWEHFCNQRAVDSHTQLETRKVAQMIKDVIYGES
jgi:hypothetical protein